MIQYRHIAVGFAAARRGIGTTICENIRKKRASAVKALPPEGGSMALVAWDGQTV
jgi:hypothetical protein